MSKSETVDRRTELAANVWVSMGRPWLLGIAGALVFVLYLFALLVQQMPGQLRDDPAGAARWLLLTSESYGPWGDPLRALGLFDILHNPLLQLLLILITLVLLIQLGNVLAKAWRLFQLERQWSSEQAEAHADAHRTAGEPLPLSTVQSIYRLRLALAVDPASLTERLARDRFARFERSHQRSQNVWERTLTTGEATEPGERNTPEPTPTARAGTATATATPAQPSATAMAEAQPVVEEQLLLLRHVRQAFLRPLLLLGLFVALVAIWLIVVWGWEVAPPPLAPGAEYRYNARSLLLQYELVATASEQATIPRFTATVGDHEVAAAMGTSVRLNRGQTHLTNRPGPPALLMRTRTDAAMLSRLGQTQMVPSMGLVFPSPGSEESVVINQALGLRIVRLAGNEPIQPEQFLVEVYDVNANEIVNRIPVQQAMTTTLLVDEMPVEIEFMPLPSLLITVTHQPGIGLLWPAALLVLVGLIGYCYAPTFLLIQLAPWPIDRTVVVAQSDEAAEILGLEDWFAQNYTDQETA